ncbi:double-stranded RNA-binding protein 2 isoform X1 [Rhodamnia argentea]|uniref:Double-stranded RNA-binding protein 2 isoform X1 n=1 Tax=Rhodamnia argentea TaxID=178133 RepID=A0A8B8QGC7_9MYRT|nr:double-stranded RNA-binding protein 2 isoform X1 [Rhodamnia argentea]
MYKNQLQELAQRSCFNLPSYTCIREGPDHAPRFKATVNFNGEVFESPNYCSTLRQAEHSAAEVALNSLSSRGPSHSLAARILDETGIYKNLLQEISQRVGAPLPQYTTFRSGLGHQPVFTGKVELAGIIFTGEPAKNKKQAEKNAAMAAWSSLKQLAKESATSPEAENNDELEQITVARALLHYRLKEKIALGNSPGGSIPFPKKFTTQNVRPTSPQPQPASTSKILPLICPKTMVPRSRPSSPAKDNLVPPRYSPSLECHGNRPQKFPAAGASPYVPINQFRASCRGIAPPVTIRSAMPVYSAPPHPPPARICTSVMQAPPVRIAPPVSIRQAVPVFAAPPARKEDVCQVQKEEPPAFVSSTPPNQSAPDVGVKNPEKSTLQEESAVVQSIDKLKI